MKTATKTLGFAVLAGAMGFALGCVQTPLEAHWGDPVHANRSAMTVNPDAGAVTGPIEGMDPLTAEHVVKTYEKNQQKDDGENPKLFLISQ